ncbi:hypothetical protein BDF19DRAFT_412249 [Syncephalis fuscata]|nr:hypothetical protein BDF19DRAFT_412249 [Syncephalis fuscata]
MGNSVGKREVDCVDGGALLANGLYSESAQDYDHRTVRRLMLDRRVAPFYKGLADLDEIKGIAAIAGLCTDGVRIGGKTACSHGNPNRLAKKRSLEGFHRKRSGSLAMERALFSISPGSGDGDTHEQDTGSTVQHGRADLRRQAVTNHGLNNGDRHHRGQRDTDIRLSIADLYRNAIECPICFLYYPRNINYSRCCHQPICTECFLQIKRNASDITNPAPCPFCVKPNFGVVYMPPSSAEFYLVSDTKDNEKLDSRASSPIEGDIDPHSPDRKINAVTSDEIRPDLLRRSQRRLVNASLAVINERRRAGRVGGSIISASQGDPHIVSGNSTNRTSNTNSDSSNGNSSGNRHRRSATTNNTAYMAAMRTMGVDLEEMMVAEAIRLSLLDQTTATSTDSNEDTTTNEHSESPNTSDQLNNHRSTPINITNPTNLPTTTTELSQSLPTIVVGSVSSIDINERLSSSSSLALLSDATVAHANPLDNVIETVTDPTDRLTHDQHPTTLSSNNNSSATLDEDITEAPLDDLLNTTANLSIASTLPTEDGETDSHNEKTTTIMPSLTTNSSQMDSAHQAFTTSLSSDTFSHQYPPPTL